VGFLSGNRLTKLHLPSAQLSPENLDAMASGLSETIFDLRISVSGDWVDFAKLINVLPHLRRLHLDAALTDASFSTPFAHDKLEVLCIELRHPAGNFPSGYAIAQLVRIVNHRPIEE
jgi:hypothetical protein